MTGTNAGGGIVTFTIRATDGGSQIATASGQLIFNATSNSITCITPTGQQVHLGTVNPGCTPGFFNPGSQPGVSIYDNVSFSTAASVVVNDVYFQITNSGPVNFRLEP